MLAGRRAGALDRVLLGRGDLATETEAAHSPATAFRRLEQRLAAALRWLFPPDDRPARPASRIPRLAVALIFGLFAFSSVPII